MNVVNGGAVTDRATDQDLWSNGNKVGSFVTLSSSC